jgi:hypothetical protein
MAIAQFEWKILGDVIIGVTGSGDMPEVEWQQFVAAMRSQPVTKYIQFAAGGTVLSSVQRKIGIDAVNEKKIKVVMVTDSPIVRGVVTAASWFGVKVSSWRPTQLEEAVNHLGVGPELARKIIVAIGQMAEGVR